MEKQARREDTNQESPTKKRIRTLPRWLLVILIPLWACGVFYLVQMLFVWLFRWILPEKSLTMPTTQSAYTVISDIVALLIIVLVPIIFRKTWKTTRGDLGLLGLPTWTDIAIAPIGYFIYILISRALFTVFEIFPWFNPTETQEIGYNYSLLYGSDRVITIITIVIIVPVIEEIIFRGFIYGKLKKVIYQNEKSTKKSVPEKATHSAKNTKKKPFWKAESVAIIAATFITSLAFALLHGQWNVGVDVFAMSVVLCVMREISGSIYPGILLHIIKNALAFFLLTSAFYS